MVSPSRISRKNKAPTTTSLMSLSPESQACIKKRATRGAFTVAMPSATGALKGPKSRVAANTVSPVPTSSAKNTAKYTFRGDDDECADIQDYRVRVDQIKEWKKINPDNVAEVTEEATELDPREEPGSSQA